MLCYWPASPGATLGWMRIGCALPFLLATLSPGVMILVLWPMGFIDGPLDSGAWCSLGWVAIVVGLVGLGVKPGMAQAEQTHRLRRGQCLVCGYDLRSTPDRCPECGTVPGNARAASTLAEPQEKRSKKSWLDRKVSPIWVLPALVALILGHFGHSTYAWELLATTLIAGGILWFSSEPSN